MPHTSVVSASPKRLRRTPSVSSPSAPIHLPRWGRSADTAPGLLDLQDAAHAARALANGLQLAIEGLGPGEDREALGRIGDLLGREIGALAEGIAATNRAA
ncbi:MAG: hypothetical protein ACFE0R_15660 [Salinarimonas sp.]